MQTSNIINTGRWGQEAGQQVQPMAHVHAPRIAAKPTNNGKEDTTIS